MPDVSASLADVIAKVIDLWCNDHPDLTIKQICDAFDEILACCKGMEETALAKDRHADRKVHHLGLVPPAVRAGEAPQPAVIQFMKRMLKYAETGEIQSVAIAYAKQAGTPGQAYAQGERNGDFWVMAAAVVALQHRIGALMNADENCVVVSENEPS